MLFGYPIEATQENWFHECLIQIINTIHDNIIAGNEPPIWPEIIPENYRELLKNRAGLRDRLEIYKSEYVLLSTTDKNIINDTIIKQNRIQELLACNSNCMQLEELPDTVQEPIRELFKFAFSLLSDLKIRDRQYSFIYNTFHKKDCPFCGCESFDAPGAPREDLDHYLPLSLYPFAGINLTNLVPMGIKCNERYKLAKNILLDNLGNRRKAFFPYSDIHISISLKNSIFFENDDGILPNWIIDFEPTLDECNSWDDIFNIRQRYKRDVLDPSFENWFGCFRKWFLTKKEILNFNSIYSALIIYKQDLNDMDSSGRDFLRPVIFDMFIYQIENGNERLNNLLNDLVTI